MSAAAQYQASHDADYHDPEQDAHHPDVQTHVSIQNVAEFVSDYALQFVSVQQVEAASRYRDRRVARRKPGGKRIDTVFRLEHVDFRNGHAGSYRHFLDDVSQASP